MKVKLFGFIKSFIKQHISTIRWKSSSGFLNNSLKIIDRSNSLKDIIKNIRNIIGTEINFKKNWLINKRYIRSNYIRVVRLLCYDVRTLVWLSFNIIFKNGVSKQNTTWFGHDWKFLFFLFFVDKFGQIWPKIEWKVSNFGKNDLTG